MTKEQLISKFNHHVALAAEAARHGCWSDMDHEDALAELCFFHLLRVL